MDRSVWEQYNALAIVPHVRRDAIELLFSLLAIANRYAADTGQATWQFAVTLAEVKSLGVTSNDLRWLMRKGWVQHGIESPSEHIDRDVLPIQTLRFREASCFVFTSKGRELFHELELSVSTASSGNVEKPTWDNDRSELSLNGIVVKKFRCRAANQEAVLTAFETDGWPSRIDDPLPFSKNTDPKRRLGDTIKCLNRHQQTPALRFRGDGTGEGVVWVPITSRATVASAASCGRTPALQRRSQ